MRIYLAADHAGFALKEKLKKYLEELGHDVEDKGAFSLDDQDDYPDFVRPVAEAVARDVEGLAPSEPAVSRGIILGGSGQGEAMVANRFKGVRAAVYYGGTKEIVILSREHNNANVLALGARFITDEEAKSVTKLWIETQFKGEERHVRRIDKIDRF